MLVTRYTVRKEANTEAKLRLVLLHHAGGSSAFYQSWFKHLPHDVEGVAVDLPGRQASWEEPNLSYYKEAIWHIRKQLDSLDSLPTILFGHSMGSAMAYLVAQSYEQEKHVRPSPIIGLALSGRCPPWRVRDNIGDLPIHELKQRIKDFGGVPQAMNQVPEIFEVFLKLIKADLQMVENIPLVAPHQRFTFPMLAFAGTEDRCATVHDMKHWFECSEHEPHCISLPGHHFFLAQHVPFILSQVISMGRQYLSSLKIKSEVA